MRKIPCSEPFESRELARFGLANGRMPDADVVTEGSDLALSSTHVPHMILQCVVRIATSQSKEDSGDRAAASDPSVSTSVLSHRLPAPLLRLDQESM